jgi:hypothetical protein
MVSALDQLGQIAQDCGELKKAEKYYFRGANVAGRPKGPKEAKQLAGLLTTLYL